MKTKVIKAIQTEYNGIKFRSRLEARWAVFFDAAKIKYEYEPEGYENEQGERYLPDFYLPDFDTYVEVKRDTKDGISEIVKKCEKAIVWGGEIKKILILSDVPQGKSIDGGLWHYPILYWEADSVVWGWWFFCTDACDELKADGIISSSPYRSSIETIIDSASIKAVSDEVLRNQKYCILKELRELRELAGRSLSYVTKEESIKLQEEHNAVIFKALDKARKARFEFGETPKQEE